MPVAAPLIGTGISAIGGWWNRRQQKKQDAQQQAQDQPAIAGATTAATSLGKTGAQLTGRGMGDTGQASSYYGKILGGDRAGLTEALAPEISATTDVYRGAERSVDRSGMQGASRDVARANIARDQAGKIGTLIAGARPGAADALGKLGAEQTGQGIGAMGQGASVWGQLLNGLNATRETNLKTRTYNDSRNDVLWDNIGQLLVQGYSASKTPRASGA